MFRLEILVACEESQEVTKELRELGHTAFSCDILSCSGGKPEWHIRHDVSELINGHCCFTTDDNTFYMLNKQWDAIIAFPPCTYLTVTGNRWFNVERYGDKAIERQKLRKDAIEFFKMIYNSDCPRIAIENPVGIMSTELCKPTQIIQPWEFGEPFEKKTCLWLKGLPKLQPTSIVEVPPRKEFKSGKTMATWYADCLHLPKEERARQRSKTFHGVAVAMATQWFAKGCNIE